MRDRAAQGGARSKERSLRAGPGDRRRWCPGVLPLDLGIGRSYWPWRLWHRRRHARGTWPHTRGRRAERATACPKGKPFLPILAPPARPEEVKCRRDEGYGELER